MAEARAQMVASQFTQRMLGFIEEKKQELKEITPEVKSKVESVAPIVEKENKYSKLMDEARKKFTKLVEERKTKAPELLRDIRSTSQLQDDALISTFPSVKNKYDQLQKDKKDEDAAFNQFQTEGATHREALIALARILPGFNSYPLVYAEFKRYYDLQLGNTTLRYELFEGTTPTLEAANKSFEDCVKEFCVLNGKFVQAKEAKEEKQMRQSLDISRATTVTTTPSVTPTHTPTATPTHTPPITPTNMSQRGRPNPNTQFGQSGRRKQEKEEERKENVKKSGSKCLIL